MSDEQETQPRSVFTEPDEHAVFIDLVTSLGFDTTDANAMVTIAALFVGPDVKAISTWVGQPVEWVQPVADRLVAGNAWQPDPSTDDDYFIYIEDPETFDSADLVMMVGIAQGIFKLTLADGKEGDDDDPRVTN